MAAAGTLLTDLGSSGGGGDGDLVQKILSDMNIPTQQPRPIPSPMPMANSQEYTQSTNSVQPIAMDSRIPTSHMIGNEHPTPADFAAAMIGVANARPDIGMNAAPVGAPMPGAMPVSNYTSPSKNIYGYIVDEIKVPFVVSILFFIFSLPPIRILVAHYMPTLIRATGEFHISGLLVISLFVGITFWVLQRVISPLLSL